MKLEIIEKKVQYHGAFNMYKNITNDGQDQALLMESKTKNLAYGKQSIVATGLALKISGKNDRFKIEALNEQGSNILKYFSKDDFGFAAGYKQDDMCIEGKISRLYLPNLTEQQRIRKTSQGDIIRAFMNKFESDNNYLGLYGMFAYDFVRNFENIGNIHQDEPGDDFTLFLPSKVNVFDDLAKQAKQYEMHLPGKNEPFEKYQLKLSDKPHLIENMSDEEFMDKVALIRNDVKDGRFMQCVFSKSEDVSLTKHPFFSYEILREINPSPYCFYFDMGKGDYMYGASPEIHLVVENGRFVIRPLAGTAGRSLNPLEDYELKLGLLTDPKERSEHAMLVDLARNEAYRLCIPESVKIDDLFTIERYKNLIHMASGISGILQDKYDSIDALLTTIPAGTLSGAPKREAMIAIEELETHRRGFYGGAIGYIAFNGDCNTGITIRSINVTDGYSRIQAGVGVVLGSNPINELKEFNKKTAKTRESQGVRVK